MVVAMAFTLSGIASHVLIKIANRQSLAAANDVRGFAPKVQAIFFRRRHQPRRPPQANIRPGSPAPATGPGTGEYVGGSSD
jgi:hypothetical protein